MATYSQLRNIDPDDEAQLLDTIDRWVEREVKPIVKEYDHADRYPTETVEQMKELGLFGATVVAGVRRARAAGRDLRQDRHAHLARLDGRDRHLQLAPDAGARDREVRHRPRRRARGCRKLATGEVRGGLALTEPDAGTDLQGIRTTAGATATATSSTAPRPGSRTASRASCFALLVKTDPEAQPRHKGMSLFIAPKQAGFTRRAQAREARLQVDRFRRAGVRGLSRVRPIT